jgi:outer membrane immunogenic protein
MVKKNEVAMKYAGIAGALAVSLAAAAVTAHAADLPSRPAYAPPAAVPVYNWTGIYLGINGGYGWGKQDPLSLLSNQFDSFNTNIDGWMFGGTFGAQIQSGHVVLGVEGDIDWANIKGTATVVPTILGAPAPFSASLATEITSVSTVRVRIGYAAQNWLLYGTGGVAVVSGKTNARLAGVACGTVGNLPCSGDSTRVGVAAGGGVEYGITPNWSVKAEYLWMGAAANDAYINTVRTGLNYRFGG